MTSRRNAAGIILVVSVAFVTWILGGVTALAYLAVLALATAPGLPLGFRLFGARHPAGWVAGMLFGYAVAGLTCWAVVFAGRASTAGFVAAWAIATAATWVLASLGRSQGSEPLVTLPRWTTRDTAALLLVMQLVPILLAPPFARIGAMDDQGNRLYRAYFTADFVWHAAIVAELRKHAQPPRNPFLASEPIHYYWTYFLVPAAVGPMVDAGVELSLKVNALAASLLFVAILYLAAWCALPTRPWTVAAAVFLTMTAASAEGLAAIVYVLHGGQSLGALRDLNVDAMARGFGGLRIDNLPREMWYTPHHSTACALGLISVPVAIALGVRARWPAILLTGLAFGASVTFNPLVGGIFCAVYGAIVLADAVRSRATVRDVARHTIAILPVLLALGWLALNQIADGVGGAFQFGWLPAPFSGALPSFLLSFGPVLILLVVGFWPQREVAFRMVFGACVGVLVSVLVMHFVVMKVDVFWVGFRTGELVFVFAPALIARGLVTLEAMGPTVVASVVAFVLLAGAPTTVIDIFNAQDVENTTMGPGFHWTVRITPAEQEALAWIRDRTPVTAIVQAEPTVRGRETWSLIPTWAERRMAGGEPIALMHIAAYDVSSARVREIYESPDPAAAWRTANELHIDYLYVDATEREAYPNVAKFDASGGQFQPVFRNREVVVYAVRGASPE